jgi:hypothetical protein
LKLKDVFNRKKLNWTSAKEYDVNEGKIDTHPITKIFLFLPLALAFSCILIIITVVGVPKTMEFFKSAVGNFQAQDELKASAEEVLFDDVKADSKYFDSLTYLKKTGIIGGFSDNTFRPYQEMKRAELVKTIVAAKKQFPLALNYNKCFTDVNNEWYAPSVCLAKEKGWIKGYVDGSFHPNETLTKAEALKMVLEAFAVGPDITDVMPANMFQDLDQQAWYFSYVRTALIRKLIDENPNLEFYKPDDPALRGDVAQLIYRVLQQT